MRLDQPLSGLPESKHAAVQAEGRNTSKPGLHAPVPYESKPIPADKLAGKEVAKTDYDPVSLAKAPPRVMARQGSFVHEVQRVNAK